MNLSKRNWHKFVNLQLLYLIDSLVCQTDRQMRDCRGSLTKFYKPKKDFFLNITVKKGTEVKVYKGILAF